MCLAENVKFQMHTDCHRSIVLKKRLIVKYKIILFNRLKAMIDHYSKLLHYLIVLKQQSIVIVETLKKSV
jgi:hypothetical protein